MKWLPLAALLSLGASAQGQAQAQAQTQDRPDRPPPPPYAAVQVCRTAAAGAACQFAAHDRTIEGTCLAPPGLKLACVPKGFILGEPPPPGDAPPPP